jgi:hypothetical protein
MGVINIPGISPLYVIRRSASTIPFFTQTPVLQQTEAFRSSSRTLIGKESRSINILKTRILELADVYYIITQLGIGLFAGFRPLLLITLGTCFAMLTDGLVRIMPCTILSAILLQNTEFL